MRLQTAAKRGHAYDELLSEVEQLRTRLSGSEKRGRELKAELSRRSISDVHVKTENYEHSLTPVSPSASLPMHSHQRSGASLGLMVGNLVFGNQNYETNDPTAGSPMHATGVPSFHVSKITSHDILYSPDRSLGPTPLVQLRLQLHHPKRFRMDATS